MAPGTEDVLLSRTAPLLTPPLLFCLHLSFNLTSQSIFNNLFSFSRTPAPSLFPVLDAISQHNYEGLRFLTCEWTVLWSVWDSPHPTYAQPFYKNKHIYVWVLLRWYFKLSNQLFFLQASTDLPPNTPTNLVLQLYSLGTGPKTMWRQQVRVTCGVKKRKKNNWKYVMKLY